jgi:hypothetical protein
MGAQPGKADADVGHLPPRCGVAALAFAASPVDC